VQRYSGLAQENQDGAGVVWRPSIVASDKYEAVSRAYIRALHCGVDWRENGTDRGRSSGEELTAITGFECGLCATLVIPLNSLGPDRWKTS
jgi:hypothetical protein